MSKKGLLSPDIINPSETFLLQAAVVVVCIPKVCICLNTQLIRVMMKR